MSRIIASRLLFGALILFSTLVASAAPITVPTGLNVGDTYRLVFVTRVLVGATSSDIADYNALVTNAANGVAELAALGTTWKAIGSTSGVDARDNTATNPNVSVGVPIYRLDDVLVANNNDDLWDGDVAATISIDEAGIQHNTLVWTGTNTFGAADPSSPLGNLATNLVAFGYSTQLLGTWINTPIPSGLYPGNSYAIYGLSDPITIQSVPEPNAMVLACSAAGGLAVSVHRRRKHRQRQ